MALKFSIHSTIRHGGGLRERRKVKCREQIVAAAERLVRDTGGVDFSMRSLADEAELSVGTVYNLVGSKDAVLCALQVSVVEKLELEMERLEQLEPLKALFAIAEMAARNYAADAAFHRVLMRSVLASDYSYHNPRVLSVRLWQKPLQAAIRAGLLRADADAEYIAFDLLTGFLGALVWWIHKLIDEEGLRAQVLSHFILTILAFSNETNRAELWKKYRSMEHELPAELATGTTLRKSAK